MPTTEKLRTKLMAKLTELFQLDQPDLDFGFYRIMQAKAGQVKSFIDNDLLQIIEDAFGQVDETRKAELAVAVETAIQTAKDFGAPNPEETEPVKKAKAALDALRDGATAESDVYDHLYRFFERYYDEGDFISRRYYARETAGKAAPFAIPYNGEEVKLHWANADQYYIKTAEYFSNYSFDLTQAAEIRKMSDGEKVLNRIPEKTLKVHFRIVDASEGEHGNVKAAEDKKRFFILHEENPVEFNETQELVINFEYKALPGGKNDVDADTEKALKEKFGKSLNKGDMPNLAIAEKVIKALEATDGVRADSISALSADNYLKALKLAAPTDKISNRPLLAKYINQYTARNTCDYFIHKDLSGFLKRELDFYIKNEVMHLDDIEHADAPAVENYLAKLKVIRKIATKLIDFLAQLEDFQKKLWLKKKFVLDTNYCMTLDRVPEELYEEIAKSDEQREEWVKLFAIDEIKGDAGGLPGMGSPAYSVPLTTDFLKANDKLVLDTAFFRSDFKARLIASIEDFDEQCDGLLIHSENFQALNLLQERYREQVKCVYIDPPFNTGSDFAYKDSFQNSSWISFLRGRQFLVKRLISKSGSSFMHLDHNANFLGRMLMDEVYGENNFKNELIWHYKSGGRQVTAFSRKHDTIFFYAKNKDDSSFFPDSVGVERGVDKKNNMKKGVDDDGRVFYSIKSAGKIYKYYEDEKVVPDDVWSDISHIQQKDPQRVGFLTQKPEHLIKRIFDSVTNHNDICLDFFSGSGTTISVSQKMNRKWVGVEMGNHFFSTVLPRLKNTLNGHKGGISKEVDYVGGGCFKYIRLESYEDTLNNLVFDSRSADLSIRQNAETREKVIQGNPSLKEDYMLRYLLNVETRGSQSLLNIDAFADPTAYALVVKKPGSDEQVKQPIDLIETFNYLLGLRLETMAAPQTFTASFTRKPDPELPEDQHTKLVVDGKIQQTAEGKWWFRKLEGWVPADPMNPNNGQKERVLIVWRTLTGNLEEDNRMLDEWFEKTRISTRDFEYDTIYVNGSNNLPNLKKDDEHWKVRLIEEEFHKKMWEVGE